jgi:REP element-mobilizing transposase RayT
MALPKRKRIRLPDYDYSSAGAYFVTICIQDRRCILSDIAVGDGVLDVPNVRLSPYGKIVAETLREIEETYALLSLDHYVIMPNHVHLLLRIVDTEPPRKPAPANSRLAALISTLKRFTNRRCGVQLWQRSYHEHVIRNENDYRETWEYIEANPARWAEDRYFIECAYSAEEKGID